jgi:dTDP-glucose 4,6-dehydratase
VNAYHHTYGLETTISNCSNNYGPYHFPEKLIPLVLTNILFDKPLPIYGNGQQIRDWLYVTDHARGIDLVLQKGRLGECYNIGGINEWANIDIVNLICELMNEQFASNVQLAEKYPQATQALAGKSQELITYVTDRAGHDQRYAINPTKSNDELGYEPAESFETGIRKTISWYLDNQSWWTPLLQGGE